MFRRIIWDQRISSDQFRLWHYFRDQMDKHGYVREYYASMRVIEVALQCKHESITKWIERLKECGYLTWTIHGKEHRHLYRVFDGFGRLAWAKNVGQAELALVHALPSDGVPPSAHTNEDGVPPSGHTHIEGKGKEGGKSDRPRDHWDIRKEKELFEQFKREVGRLPPGSERDQKMAKIKIRLKQLENEALGYEPSNDPATESKTAVPVPEQGQQRWMTPEERQAFLQKAQDAINQGVKHANHGAA